MNYITWKVLSTFSHSASITDEECVVYREKETPVSGYPASLAGLPLTAERTCEFRRIID